MVLNGANADVLKMKVQMVENRILVVFMSQRYDLSLTQKEKHLDQQSNSNFIFVYSMIIALKSYYKIKPS